MTIEAAASVTLASVLLGVCAALPARQTSGDIYYVGAAGVSAFLIRTPEGSVLLDGGLRETARAPNPFIDPSNLRLFNAQSELQFQAALEKERAALHARRPR